MRKRRKSNDPHENDHHENDPHEWSNWRKAGSRTKEGNRKEP
jgi:hypothetical protein